MDQGKLPTDVRRETLPDHRDLALFVATLFQRLGGTLAIDAEGGRYAQRPAGYSLPRGAVPQLPDAKPSERFRSAEEWEGAIKLAEYWLNRLSGPDREYVFTLMAQPALNPREDFDFRDLL